MGVVFPVVWTNGATAILGSLLFGGTFTGITTLILSMGRQCAPSRSQRVMAIMTACFGMGQMIGPLGAGALMRVTHAYAPALLGSGILLLGAGGLLWLTRRKTPADRLPPSEYDPRPVRADYILGSDFSKLMALPKAKHRLKTESTQRLIWKIGFRRAPLHENTNTLWISFHELPPYPISTSRGFPLPGRQSFPPPSPLRRRRGRHTPLVRLHNCRGG